MSETGTQPGNTWSIPKPQQTVAKTVQQTANYDPNSQPPTPQAYANQDGVYVLNGLFGVGAYKFQGAMNYDTLTFEHLHSINGYDLLGNAQTHVGSVYVGPSGVTRFFFSQTPTGSIQGETVYPLYMSVNGIDFFRVLTPTGTRLVA
jgi:hypothetical protein